MDLKDARILITGGSLGIGKASAKILADAGAKVAITGRDEERIKRAAEECNAFPIVADVSDEKDIERTYELFLKTFDHLDVLINNAGIGGRFRHIDELTMDDLQSVFAVNVFGAALMASGAARLFKEQNYGHIINIGSTSGLKGGNRASVYSATKFALRSFTQSWQTELRPYNVRVILINPSEVATAFANEQRIERQAPQNKLRSEEIAYAVKAALQMDNRGFIPEFSVWATNPW
ncbi:MAG: SDR family NAD(P)-dependent oxidoreductase [Caldithrix sp.]|nr:SDR family NAD(P)-dependent oxidoreductase [Caldithrix sp.]